MVRRILSDEWAELRDIRLRLLTDVPWRVEHLAVEQAFTQAQWEERSRTDATSAARAGFVGCDWDGIVEVDDGEIEGLWVSPGHRRRGLATELLEAAIDWAAARGQGRVESWVREQNAPGIAAHAAAGFVLSGRVQQWPDRAAWQVHMFRVP